jgi:hypothetical protein
MREKHIPVVVDSRQLRVESERQMRKADSLPAALPSPFPLSRRRDKQAGSSDAGRIPLGVTNVDSGAIRELANDCREHCRLVWMGPVSENANVDKKIDNFRD